MPLVVRGHRRGALGAILTGRTTTRSGVSAGTRPPPMPRFPESNCQPSRTGSLHRREGMSSMRCISTGHHPRKQFLGGGSPTGGFGRPVWSIRHLGHGRKRPRVVLERECEGAVSAGGAWNDATYMYRNVTQASPLTARRGTVFAVWCPLQVYIRDRGSSAGRRWTRSTTSGAWSKFRMMCSVSPESV